MTVRRPSPVPDPPSRPSREPRIRCPVDWGDRKPCDVVRNVAKDTGRVVLLCYTCGKAEASR
jgi:hypothetical protein